MMAKNSVRIQIWTTCHYKQELDAFCQMYGLSYAEIARVGMRLVMNLMSNPIQSNLTVITSDVKNLAESMKRREIWNRAKDRRGEE